MIEEGKTYKLKKIKGINNTDQNCTILKIVDSPNKELGKIAFYQLDNGDRYVAPVSEFIDPEDPKEYSDLLFQKLESVMKPMNLTFWKQLKEEGAAGGMASLGAAPCPAMGQITSGGISGCLVNGIPVAGKSVKKKKSKKNEASFSGIVVEQEEIDKFDIKDVKNYFKNNLQQTKVYNRYLKDYIQIIGKTWSKTENKIKTDAFFLLFKQLDFILETAYTNAQVVQNNKNRDDDIKGWYYLYNTVLFGQDLIKVKLDVAISQIGNKIYYIRKPKEETLSGVPLSEINHPHVNRNRVSNNSIIENEEKANPYNLIPGKEYDLTPYFHITLLESNKKELSETLTLPKFNITQVAEAIQYVKDILGIDVNIQVNKEGNHYQVILNATDKKGLICIGTSINEVIKKAMNLFKKNEAIEPLFIPDGFEDKYKEKTEVVVTPEEMLDEIEDTFDPASILITFVENGREKIKISVQYDTSYPAYLHILKLEFLDIDDSIVDEIIEEDLAIQDCIEELKYLFKTHKRPNIEFSDLSSDEIDEALSIFSPEMDEAGRQYHRALMDYADGKIERTQFASIKKKFMDMLAQCDPDLNENFLEEYEDITDLIAKQLDRLDFKFANTDDIIYKKEGQFKYLIKFDNEIGVLKFKVSKDQDVIFEKEYQLENEEDVTNAFEQIENIYRENGI